VTTLVTRRQDSPSSSVRHICPSVLSDDTHVKGSVPCVLGMVAGKTGTSGRLGMFEVLMKFGQIEDVDEVKSREQVG